MLAHGCTLIALALHAQQVAPPPHPLFGQLLAAAGDVDADGAHELLVGDTDPHASRIWMVSLKQRKALYSVPGPREGASFTSEIALLGDLDGDHVDDWILGGSSVDACKPTKIEGELATRIPHDDRPGEVWVRSGKDGKLLFSILDDRPEQQLGCCVAAAGDFDGDGARDFVLGCERVGKPGSGGPLLSIRSGKDGREVAALGGGEDEGTRARRITTVGDIDGDGRADVLVAVDGHGKNARWLWISGANGQTLRRAPRSERGRWDPGVLRVLADRNADGIADVLMGESSIVRIVSGRDGSTLLELTAMTWANEAARLSSVYDGYGAACVPLGGANAIPPVRFVVSAPSTEVYGGSLFVHDARSGERLAEQVNPIEERHHLGHALDNAGDVDGDGWDDLAVGYDNSSAGRLDCPVIVLSGATLKPLLELRRDGMDVVVR